MGGKTRQGFPIPSDRNPDHLPANMVFPWDQAATVVTTAESVGIAAVRTYIEIIRRMLGNPDAVAGITGAWRGAVQELTSAVDGSDHGEGLQTAKENMAGRWSGAASQAAVSYVDRIVTSTNDTKGSIADCSNQIDNFRSTVTNNYILAIGHITKCATILLNLTGGIIASIEEIADFKIDVAGITNAIVKAVNDFMEEVGKIFQEVIKYRDEITKTVGNIETTVAKVAIPPKIADVAGDNSAWTPRKLGT